MSINTDYKKMKLCKHGLPTWDSLIPLILLISSENKTITRKELIKSVIERLKLPNELRNLTSDKYPEEKIIDSRIGWPISEVTLGGLLARPTRGIYKITKLGDKLLEKYGNNLTSEIIHSQPLYIQHQLELSKKDKNISPVEINEQSDRVNELSSAEKIVKQFNDQVSIELLDRIRSNSSYFFEKLVVELLSEMGYKGENGKAIVTKKSNDNGIDGIINQDALGTRTVYIQAKKYAIDNNVQRNEVQSFVGALSGYSSDRGVFITTSDFTSGALEYAKNQRIVLINGIKLSDLMLQYQVGVNTKKKYVAYDIDEDFFIND